MPIGTKPFKGKVSKVEAFTSPKTGKQYWKFTFRTSRKGTGGEWEGEFWNATSFNPVLDGEKIEVTEFSLEQRKYTDRNNVSKTAYNMTIWKHNGSEMPQEQPKFSGFEDVDESDDDELPF